MKTPTVAPSQELAGRASAPVESGGGASLSAVGVHPSPYLSIAELAPYLRAYGLRFSAKRKTPNIEFRRAITLLRLLQVAREGNKTGDYRRLCDMIVKDDYPTRDVLGIAALVRLAP